MGQQANQFLASFNRIEKWMRDQENLSNSVGFTELVRRLTKRSDLLVRHYRDDLIEMAQLRNAIVHDKIGPDFVIAEPNDWVLKKLALIEKRLTKPELVTNRFKKEVSFFNVGTPLSEVLKIVAEKGYSQFPIFQDEKILGLITSHGLGMWLAKQDVTIPLSLVGKHVEDVLSTDRRRHNYQFVPAGTYIFQAVEIFLADPTIEALLITQDGQESKALLGIIRPKEIFQKYYKEWWQRE